MRKFISQPIRTFARPLACSALLLGASIAAAHHPIQAKFDAETPTTLTGRVTAIDWRNPHAHVFINVTGPNGIENWAVEVESPNILRANAWTSESLQPGDEVNV